MTRPPFLQRIVISNYRSIAACNLKLNTLNFLVVPNGSGKSNFLDALRLVADALQTTLDHAIRERGGINEVRRRSNGHPTHFGMRLEFTLPNGRAAHYAFRVGARPDHFFGVQREECSIGGASPCSFRVEEGTRTDTVSKRVVKDLPFDRLHLVAASSEPQFRPVFDALSDMAFFNLNPDRMRELQTPDSGAMLKRDGSNAASVLRSLTNSNPDCKRRIEDFLQVVVPGVVGVEHISVGPKESLQFRQEIAGASNPWHFHAPNMSDGTLRALGIFLALFQEGDRRRPTVIGIEEPEIALHPAAVGALIEALREAALSTQVILTSHSPDLLDLADISREAIIAVHAEKGNTQIAPIGEASRKNLADGLYTPGELLRLNQLRPDVNLFKAAIRESKQMNLFDREAAA